MTSTGDALVEVPGPGGRVILQRVRRSSLELYRTTDGDLVCVRCSAARRRVCRTVTDGQPEGAYVWPHVRAALRDAGPLNVEAFTSYPVTIGEALDWITEHETDPAAQERHDSIR